MNGIFNHNERDDPREQTNMDNGEPIIGQEGPSEENALASDVGPDSSSSSGPPGPQNQNEGGASVGGVAPDTETDGKMPGRDNADAAQLLRENADLRDQLLRTLAEMENLRRRTDRQLKETSSYAIANFARDMLDVGDNLSRAIGSLPEEARTAADASGRALIEGVEMTERQLLQLMEKYGVRKIDPAGEKFNPNFHQAMFQVNDESVPPGQVVHVMQPGYVLGERILRPALVGVSTGGTKAPSAPETHKTPTDDTPTEGREGDAGLGEAPEPHANPRDDLRSKPNPTRGTAGSPGPELAPEPGSAQQSGPSPSAEDQPTTSGPAGRYINKSA